jgi:ATP-dependent exoDNAse (exonuclease V) beta subunit
MPATSTAKNPKGLEITFTESDHKYIDSNGKIYTSITTFINQYFPTFETDKIAQKKADKIGVEKETLIQQWKDNAKEACNYGTRVHENCEHLMIQDNIKLHEPENEKEKIAFRTAEKAVRLLKAKYKFRSAEQIVFSERLGIAGTIDLTMFNKNKDFLILDYKTNKKIKDIGFNNQMGLDPINHIQDANYYHYAIQLSLAEYIMKLENYIPRDYPTKRALIYIPPMSDKPEYIKTPDMTREVGNMLIYHATK